MRKDSVCRSGSLFSIAPCSELLSTRIRSRTDEENPVGDMRNNADGMNGKLSRAADGSSERRLQGGDEDHRSRRDGSRLLRLLMSKRPSAGFDHGAPCVSVRSARSGLSRQPCLCYGSFQG